VRSDGGQRVRLNPSSRVGMAEPDSIRRLYENSERHQPFETVAAELIGLVGPAMVERTRDAIQINCEPEEIGPVLLVTPVAFLIDRVHPPAPTSRVVSPSLT